MQRQAGLGIKLALDKDGFPVIVGFESGYASGNATSPHLEIGCRILSVDSQHTQSAGIPNVYRWLRGALGSSVLLCLARPASTPTANMEEWEVVLMRTVVCDIQTPRQSQKHYYLVCLRRMLRHKQDDFHKPVGVGIAFDTDSHGRFRVGSIYAGGSAQESGQVTTGDVLFSVNGLQVQGRSTDNVIQLVKGAPGTRIALVLVTDPPVSARSHPGQDSFRYDAFSVVPQIGKDPGEIVAVIIGAQGLVSQSAHPAIFCQLRMIDLSGEGELREELVGVSKAGLALGMRVIKSRFFIEREADDGCGASEGALGTISYFDPFNPGTCSVLWDSGEVQPHSIGENGVYDLEIAPQMTTISKTTLGTRWDNVISLRVRDSSYAALEITIWDRETYLGETLVHVDGLVEQQGEFEEQALSLSFEEVPTSAEVLLACAWFAGPGN